MRINKKSKPHQWLHKSLRLLVIFVFVFAQLPAPVFAQYTGGSFGGDEESSIGDEIFAGGSQQGSGNSNSSSSGSLAHGTATKLVFTQTPSTGSGHDAFERQPIVEIRDSNNNLVTTDNSSQVTVAIFNNLLALNSLLILLILSINLLTINSHLSV